MRLAPRAPRALTALLLAGAGVLAAAALPAQAASASTGRAALAGPPYSVTAYETVNIRSAPNTGGLAFDKILAGETRNDAVCWEHGETISDNGYTNDIWIGFTEGWASAVYLKGDQYAGLPAGAECRVAG